MRHALALAILLVPTFAHAENANQRAEKEAIHFLKPCRQKSPADVLTCEQNQTLFVEAYVFARSGSPIGMLQVAGYFGARHTPEEREAAMGIPEDILQSCAWLIMNAARTSSHFTADTADFSAQTVCPGVSVHAYGAAFVRAGAIARELRADPASDLPDGWRPHIPWIKGNPLPLLDSTAVPFKAD